MIDEINPYSNKGFCLYKKLSCSSAIPSKGKMITKNANIVFVSIVLLPPLVAAFNSAGFSNCLRASNMRLQRSEKQHLFLCSFKI